MRLRGFTIPLLAIVTLVLSILAPVTVTQANAAAALVTCVNLQTGSERISHTGKCRYTQEAQANWHKNPSDSPIASGTNAKIIVICSNKESSPVSYQVIRKKCARHQVTIVYSRSGAIPAKPAITQVVSFGHDSSQISLAQNPETNPDAPVAFYTVNSSKGNTQKIYSWKDLSLVISGLQAQTTYTFTVSATTADGTSPLSTSSLPVTTPAYVPPAPVVSVAPLAVPAFSISSVYETVVATTSLVGYTISSTGGAVASYSVSPALPTGLTLNSSTGLIAGTPTETRTATAYTITATNASGSASATYRLRVTGDIGDTGPGRGTIFYYSAAGFNCGTGFSATGSPTGGKCKYLEAAWADSGQFGWSGTSDRSVGPLGTAIGIGYRNTVEMINQSNTPEKAGTVSHAYSGPNNLSDWYLPSKDELNELYLQRVTVGGFSASSYWSSSEYGAAPNMAALSQDFVSGVQSYFNKVSSLYVRPIRAF